MRGEPLLELSGITRGYGPSGGTRLDVLRGIDLQVSAGDIVAVTGPSGSGKSTLLNIIGTLDSPDGGAIAFAGRDLLSLKGRELHAFRSREIGFVFQRHHLLPHLTLLENVLVPTLNTGGKGAAERAQDLLARVGLENRIDHFPGALSVGECQRAAVVRALVNGPSLLLADEPTGSLDREGADRLGNLLAELNDREGITLLMVTHSRRLAERAERAFELRDGTLRPREGP